ncbi:MAG: hypothetical protein IKT35_01155 [Clostridia bacterium]|nr:hypothetical protein [Clostridia bacterium]
MIKFSTNNNKNKKIRDSRFKDRLPTIRAGMVTNPPSPTDVLGSYTGRPIDFSKPVQDADDL